MAATFPPDYANYRTLLYGHREPAQRVNVDVITRNFVTTSRNNVQIKRYVPATSVTALLIWAHGYNPNGNSLDIAYVPLFIWLAERGIECHIIDYPDDTLGFTYWSQRQDEMKEYSDALNRDPTFLGGHSFGANTAVGCLGARMVVPGVGNRELVVQPNIKGAFLMSPQGPDTMTLSSTWNTIQRPYFCATGGDDVGRGGDVVWRTLAYELGTLAVDRYLSIFPRGDHVFGGLVQTNNESSGLVEVEGNFEGYIPKLIDITRSQALAFIRQYSTANGNFVARSWLRNGLWRMIEPDMICERRTVA